MWSFYSAVSYCIYYSHSYPNPIKSTIPIWKGNKKLPIPFYSGTKGPTQWFSFQGVQKRLGRQRRLRRYWYKHKKGFDQIWYMGDPSWGLIRPIISRTSDKSPKFLLPNLPTLSLPNELSLSYYRPLEQLERKELHC